MTKIRTKNGDKGMTSLIKGGRISKGSKKISFIGDLDELNSFLGLSKIKIEDKNTAEIIYNMQKIIMHMSSCFAAGKDIGSLDITFVEKKIEKLSLNTILNELVVPGFNESSALLDISRSISRRAERTFIGIKGSSNYPNMMKLLNALSDLLYLTARNLGSVPN
ncbi:MAG: cob(I)yrinic acid a,c-diamide adenosyltransferase [Candidatus Omnitrophica bacterium]|nr:cob(I)yrinic acid a,c-diamide adenosyltransferase [Candidatus Omnitrophota bacterium]